MKGFLTYLSEERIPIKSLAITTTLLMMLSCIQPASAYSPIWNVNGWDATRLKEAGITVTTWKHDQIGEEPALNWVEISYDWSKLGEDQGVLMTLQLTGDNGQTISAFRAEHKKGDSGKLKILFAVRKENVENSYVEILVPEFLHKGAEREFGNPGFGGYSLRLRRIMELAGKAAVDKSIDIDKK